MRRIRLHILMIEYMHTSTATDKEDMMRHDMMRYDKPVYNIK